MVFQLFSSLIIALTLTSSLLLLAPVPSFPQNFQNDIGGVISGTLNQRVYHITEDLVIPVGETLVIEDDIYLSFLPGRKMIVAGQLIAGERLPVRFLSEDPEAGWGGIHFLDSSQGSRCFRCRLEYIELGGVGLTIESPITFLEGSIVAVRGGTAISSTVPFTLSNVLIDFVDTAIFLSGTPPAHYEATHLTLTRCQNGIVNHNQHFDLNNTIISSCTYPIVTELSGITTISYSLLNEYAEIVTAPDAIFIQGAGMLDGVTPDFVNFPLNLALKPDSPAVNAADPQADYSIEPGFNGGRADMGVYGNTGDAPQQPPRELMGVTVEPINLWQVGRPGQTVTFTFKVKNTGSITDTYYIYIDRYRDDFGRYSRLFDYGYTGPELIALTSKAEITRTVWVEIPTQIHSTPNMSNGIHIDVFNGFGIRDEIDLQVIVLTKNNKRCCNIPQ